MAEMLTLLVPSGQPSTRVGYSIVMELQNSGGAANSNSFKFSFYNPDMHMWEENTSKAADIFIAWLLTPCLSWIVLAQILSCRVSHLRHCGNPSAALILGIELSSCSSRLCLVVLRGGLEQYKRNLD